MDTGEMLGVVVTLIGWTAGVLASIWWPRHVEAGSMKARAHSMLRYTALSLLLGYGLFLVGGSDLTDAPIGQVLLSFALTGTLLLTPLSSVALALDSGSRVRASISCVVSVLLATGLTWLCLLSALILLRTPDMPPWRGVFIVVATVLAGGSAASALELYTAVRLPRTQWKG